MTQRANQNRQQVCILCVFSFTLKTQSSAVMTSPQECASHKCLLHPSPEEEKRKHKKHLVQGPSSYFMDVKCPGCYTITTVFSHAQSIVFIDNGENATHFTYLFNMCFMCVHASRVRHFVTPWTVTCQGHLSMGLSRQETLEWVAFPPLGSNSSLLCLLHWRTDSLLLSHLGSQENTNKWSEWHVIDT